jgi:hypothetical protein
MVHQCWRNRTASSGEDDVESDSRYGTGSYGERSYVRMTRDSVCKSFPALVAEQTWCELCVNWLPIIELLTWIAVAPHNSAPKPLRND